MYNNRITLRDDLKIFMDPLDEEPDEIKKVARRMLKAKNKILAKPAVQIPKCRVQFHIDLRLNFYRY